MEHHSHQQHLCTSRYTGTHWCTSRYTGIYTLLYIQMHRYTLVYIQIHRYTLGYIQIHRYTMVYIQIHRYPFVYIKIFHRYTLVYIQIHRYVHTGGQLDRLVQCHNKKVNLYSNFNYSNGLEVLKQHLMFFTIPFENKLIVSYFSLIVH